MGVRGKRRIYKSGGSKVMTLFKDLVTGDTATVAADKLILADPQAEIPEELLHRWLEEYLEPLVAEWRKQNKGRPSK